MTNGWPSKQNPTLARKPASRISLIVSQSCDPLLGIRASSVRLVRFIVHPCVGRNPIHFPRLASILGECLFKTARLRSDIRYNEPNQDGPVIEGFLIEKLAAPVLEFSDCRLAQGAILAVGKIQTPLAGLGIVQTQRQRFNLTFWPIDLEFYEIRPSIPHL